MICLVSCDKTIPGQLMAAARLNIPSIVVACGYQPGGQFRGEHIDIEDLWIHAVRRETRRNQLSVPELEEMSLNAVLGPGVCAGMGTANTIPKGGERVDRRNRNTALVLISAGLLILLYKLLGFFTLSAILIIGLGIYKILAYEENKSGYALLVIGGLMLLGHHLSIVVGIVLISLGYFFIKSKRAQRDDDYLRRQNLLESIKWDREPWGLRSMSVWCVIGEIRMDLSLALIESEETTVIVHGVIGDVNLIVPEELGLSVEASTLFGQIKIGQERRSGLLNHVVWQSPHYSESAHKVKLLVAYTVGDIDVKIL
ncbi:cell wall-active antibiotics response protein LiaF [Ferviditalea candida]|uniref:Cell wall-active antibiotics response protein LiaF n=1 Tax=Ferviditalea candida TaxID=3108399 RepID=A0ABU5ZKT7_9BACL|nr:cell wall-active antibiotics response protein LiaF [Paenibacillaceae bacterium T2]